MRLASESPYPGERDNASAAARRLAESHGMSLGEAARAAVKPAPAPNPRPESEADVDHGARRRQARRTYWDQGYAGTEDRSKAEWLSEYARMRRQVHREMESQDRSQAFWLAFLIGAIFLVVGGVAFVVDGVVESFRLVLTNP